MTIEIIAECGVNHNGNFEIAKEMVYVAKESGADTVKFQIFDPDNLVTKKAPLAKYQSVFSSKIKSQKTLLEGLYLSIDHHHQLVNLCKKLNIKYLASVFDLKSLKILVLDLLQKRVKFGSGELSNFHLIRQATLYNCELILSTGMTDYKNIEEVIKLINFVIEHPNKIPTSDALNNYNIDQISNRISLLHCTSQYPTPLQDINLRVIKGFRKNFPFKIGLSDHSEGIISSITAVGCEIDILEKHFTLNKQDIGPDHKASLNPLEFKELVNQVRLAETAMGSSKKKILDVEKDVANVAKKSLVAAKNIKKGTIFNENNLTVKRPGYGISAKFYFDKIGMVSIKDYEKDDLIE